MTEQEYLEVKCALEKRGAQVTYAAYEAVYLDQIYVCVDGDADRATIERRYLEWTRQALAEVGVKAVVDIREWNPTQKKGLVSFEIWVTPS